MSRLLVVALLACSACASSHRALRSDANSFAVRDYLKTAYETLASAETDTDGHRVRAQLETRAALDALGDLGSSARLVPYDGPPSMSVALELLEESAPKVAHNPDAHQHTLKAVAELRAAVH
jgi:hypothetical protein